MGCAHPVRAFRTGFKTENGADEFIRCPGATTDLLSYASATKRKKVNLDATPHTFINGECFLTDPVMQPCGSCVGCRLNDSREWKIRNCLELTYHKAYFVTLTYDDEHLPSKLEKDFFVREIQLFFKRWRKSVGPCRYFGCFEFGEHTLRPHFHLIFYADIPDLVLHSLGQNHFTSKTLDSVWSSGYAMVEYITPGSIAYVCGYVEKKQLDPNWDIYPFKPFRFASRRPAIGFLYLEEHRRLFGDDPHVYGPFSESPGRNSAGLPQSFKRKLKEEDYFIRLKLAAEEAGENAQEVSKVVYKLAHQYMVENAMESSQKRKVSNLRKGTL